MPSERHAPTCFTGRLQSIPEIAVYDTTLRRYSLGCYGLTGEIAQDSSGRLLDAISYQIWLSVPPELHSILRERVTLQCLASCWSYGLEDEKKQARNASLFSFLFSVFAQGTLLGWQVTRDAALLSKPTSAIRVHEYLAKEQPHEFLGRFGDIDKTMRQMCIIDWLAFYLDHYERSGPSRFIAPSDFNNSGFSRFSYPETLVSDAFNQLCLERWFTGTRAARSIEPSRVAEAKLTVARELSNYLESILAFGIAIRIPTAR